MFVSIQMFLQLECFESLDLIPIDDVLGPINGPPLNGQVVSRAKESVDYRFVTWHLPASQPACLPAFLPACLPVEAACCTCRVACTSDLVDAD